MNHGCRSFSKTVAECLYQHAGVHIIFLIKFLHSFIHTDTGINSHGTDGIILFINKIC